MRTKWIAMTSALLIGLTCLPSIPSVAMASQHTNTGTAEGEVRKIDKDTKKITIKHGPIEAFDMSAMTMVFQTADPALLDKAQVGDKVRFTITRKGGAMVVESIEAIK